MTSSTRTTRLLIASNVASWAVLAGILLSSFTANDRMTVTELDAERINILGANGAPVMALSNKRLIPGPTFEGTEYPQAFGDGRDQLSGIIFFNEQGDEVGGLVYNGYPVDDRHWAGGHLSFDQWKQNQVVALQYLDNTNSRRAGLRVWDRPTDVRFKDFLDLGLKRMDTEEQAVRDSLRKEQQKIREAGGLGVERLFVGSQNETAQVQIRDTAGRVRVRLFVDPEDNARLEFLDAEGRVTRSFPE